MFQNVMESVGFQGVIAEEANIFRRKKEKELTPKPEPIYSAKNLSKEFTEEPQELVKSLPVLPDGNVIKPLDIEEIAAIEQSTTHELSYLAATHDLETGTPYTNLIEAYVKKMLEGETYTGNFRVCILRRGLGVKAFVLPDGTICISQSLINESGSFSGMMAIIAHEVGHLINGSHYVEHRRKSTSWVHENIGSDPETPRLLNKVGINTMSGGMVFERMSARHGNVRGDVEHHANLMRSAADIAQHTFINRSHSNTEIVPLEQVKLGNARKAGVLPQLVEGQIEDDVLSFNREGVSPTNREMVDLWVDGLVEGELIDILDNLHSRDISEFLQEMSYNYNEEKYKKHGVYEHVARFLRKRMRSGEYSETDIDCFLLSMWWNSNWEELAFQDHSYEEFLEVIRRDSKISEEQWLEMNFKLFGAYSKEQNFKDSYTSQFARHGTAVGSSTDIIKKRIQADNQINQETWLNIVEALLAETQHPGREDYARSVEDYYLPGVIGSYLTHKHFKRDKIDLVGLEQSLLKLKETGYLPDNRLGDQLKYNMRDRGSSKEKEKNDANAEKILTTQVAPLFEKVFNKSILREAIVIREYEYMTVDQLRIRLEKLSEIKHGHKFYEAFLEIYRSIHSEYSFHSYSDNERKKHDGPTIFGPLFIELRRAIKEFDLQGLTFDDRYEKNPDRRTNLTKSEDGNMHPDSLRMRLNVLCLHLEMNYGHFKQLERPKSYFVDQLQGIDQEFGQYYEQFAETDVVWSISHFLSHLHEQNLEVGESLLSSPLFTVFEQRLLDQYPMNTIQELRSSIQKISEVFNSVRVVGQNSRASFPLQFSSKLESLLLNRIVEQQMVKLLEASSDDPEGLPEIIDLIENTMSGIAQYYDNSPVLKAKVKRLRVAYIISAESRPERIKSRMDYFVKFYDHYSYQDLLSLMKQIKRYEDAAYFIDSLGQERIDVLRGEKQGGKLDAVVMADTLASMFKDKRKIAETIDASVNTSREHTTEVAKAWFEKFLQDTEERSGSGVTFDQATQKIGIDKLQDREKFATVRDMLEKLQGLSEGNKKLIAARLLLDSEGLLTSEENRVWTADLIIRVFNIKEDFVVQIVKGLIIKGRPTLVGMALAELMGPLLFKSLDLKNIDYANIGERYFYETNFGRATRILAKRKRSNKQGINFESLENIFNNKKDEVSDERRMLEDAEGVPELVKHYNLSTERSSRVYAWIDQMADKILPEEKEKKKDEAESELSPHAESLIKALESLGGIFVRGLQIGRLVYPFKPALARRLSNAFDRMQGTDEFKLWLNLHEAVKEDKRIRSGQEQADGVSLSEFIEGMVESVEAFVGGGSLASTYRGKLSPEMAAIYGFDQIAIKMLTANVDAFVDLGEETSMAALEYAEQHGSFQTKIYARLSRMVLRVSKDWCKEDIHVNSPERTEVLRHAIQRIGSEKGDRIVTAQPVYRTSNNHITAEQFLSGATLNSYLQDPEVDNYLRQNDVPFDQSNFNEWIERQTGLSHKVRETLMAMKKIFNLADGFAQQPVLVDGNEYIGMQDPHPGNMLVADGGEVLGAIDIPPNFTFTEREVKVFNILRQGNYVDFMEQFIELTVSYNQQLIDSEDVAPEEKPKKVTASEIKVLIAKEISREFVRHMFKGRNSEPNYVQRVLGVFVSQEQKVPWRWFVEIRNILYQNKERGKGGIKVNLMEVLAKKLRRSRST